MTRSEHAAQRALVEQREQLEQPHDVYPPYGSRTEHRAVSMPPDHPARSHCWRCGQRVKPGESYYTLTVPFGPVFGVEHETCPSTSTEELSS